MSLKLWFLLHGDGGRYSLDSTHRPCRLYLDANGDMYRWRRGEGI